MSGTVWLSARTLGYSRAGGHLWAYLNWALGLSALGYRVVWLEQVSPGVSPEGLAERVANLGERLAPYGLGQAIAVCCTDPGCVVPTPEGCVGLDEIGAADLLLDVAYGIPEETLGRFRRTALLDIDPGLLQLWIEGRQIDIGPHDVYFSIGETVGSTGAAFPDCGIDWQYTPPCVALEWWPERVAEGEAPFTTVSNWFEDEWVDYGGQVFRNDKKAGFEPFLNVAARTRQPLELALCLARDDDEERALLEQQRWRVQHAWDVTPTPWTYQCYVQASRGEFSCAKPSCVRLQNAWISDRTLCYLASGKPAIVQHTGPSRFLPDAEGLFRFHDVDEAVRHLETATSDYERQCRLARRLAEQHFDARKVVGSLLDRALG